MKAKLVKESLDEPMGLEKYIAVYGGDNTNPTPFKEGDILKQKHKLDKDGNLIF